MMFQGWGKLGEEDSDVDIEGYNVDEEEEEDGKPKTPAPVSMLMESYGYIIPLYDIGAPPIEGWPNLKAVSESLHSESQSDFNLSNQIDKSIYQNYSTVCPHGQSQKQ